MFRKILIVLIGFVLFVGCSPKVDQKKYENLYRAAKAIEGSVAVGVNYQKFGELLQNLSTEILIANDKAKSDSEKELLKNFLDVLAAYQESATVWKHKIEGARYEWIPSGQIYVRRLIGTDLSFEVSMGGNNERELRPIITKYSLPIGIACDPITGHKFQAISENAIQVIWGKAHEHLEKATQIYHGQ